MTKVVGKLGLCLVVLCTFALPQAAPFRLSVDPSSDSIQLGAEQ